MFYRYLATQALRVTGTISIFVVGGALLAAGCSNHASDPMEVASVAVRANPSLELVAADEKQGVLTVRVKRTGQMLVVKAADVTAGTAFRDLDAGGAAPAQPPAQPPAGQAPAQSATVSGGGGRVAVSASQGASGQDQQVAVKSAGGAVSVKSGGRSVSVQAPGQGGVSVALNGAGGISVAQSSPQAASASRPSTPAAAPSQSSTAPASSGGATIDDARLERRTRQIVCHDDSMRLDGVLIKLDDVAVVVTGDCDLKIVNSHITGNTAIHADSNATVSIVNSIVEGSTAVSLSGNATLAAKSSTVRGRIQRTQNTELHDQGGNVWK
jgi:hypothetical protein